MGFEDNAAVLTCVGNLTADNKEEVIKHADKALGMGISCLAVGLKNVNFLDSSGIGALVTIKKAAMARDGDVRLFELSPAVEDVGRWIGLRKMFQVFSTKESCLESFQDAIFN